VRAHYDGNAHHQAADANQTIIKDNFSGAKSVPVTTLQGAAGIEALLAVDMNLGRIADALEILVALAKGAS
jgi:hypothetical protein